jgi:serine phosphatase RsbU (regulator of sigma subunit)/CBS domain-containing protein
MKLTSSLRVRDVMAADPIRVTPRDSVQKVVALMNERRIGAVLVGEREHILGIFTERDMLKNAVMALAGWRELPVADWMTRDPWTIGPDASWEQALSMMETLHVRHLPVIENERIVGILSARGLMNSYTEYLNHMVEERTKELRQAYERLQHRDAELQLHMTVAARLQTRLLPGKPPTVSDMEWVGHYEPLDPLGGDYYDFAQPDPRRLGVLIADASGHSIPAAMVAIMARTAFHAVAPTTASPAAVLTGMNEQLHGLTGEHFVTAFYGVIDRDSRLLTYANAGHPFPYVYRHLSKSCEQLAARGLMLGILPESKYEERHVQLNPHDKLLFYTDGVPDCRSEQDVVFGTDRLEEFLHEHGPAPAKAMVQALVEKLKAYRGSRTASDDMSILAAEML